MTALASLEIMASAISAIRPGIFGAAKSMNDVVFIETRAT
jgi:hypothetical protein